MSDSVKQKRLIQSPLFYGGAFHMQGISNIQLIPFLVALPKFLWRHSRQLFVFELKIVNCSYKVNMYSVHVESDFA